MQKFIKICSRFYKQQIYKPLALTNESFKQLTELHIERSNNKNQVMVIFSIMQQKVSNITFILFHMFCWKFL